LILWLSLISIFKNFVVSSSLVKVILSRKGFDSSYGGFPSPILPDQTLLSLPIPSPDDHISYDDLQTPTGQSYYELMSSLSPTLHHPNRGTVPLQSEYTCHLDPDLEVSTYPREKNWRPLFGQINQAQAHLHNQQIGPGDLFLFFGWYRQAEWEDGQLHFVPGAPDLHIIYGYLEIDNVLSVDSPDNVSKWMRYHPHVRNLSRLEQPTNTLYVAKNRLSWEPNSTGGGMLTYSPDLVLTQPGQTRSRWELPDLFRDVSMTYHSENSWSSEGYFESAKRGQEFVIEESPAITHWAQSLVRNHI